MPFLKQCWEKHYLTLPHSILSSFNSAYNKWKRVNPWKESGSRIKLRLFQESALETVGNPDRNNNVPVKTNNSTTVMIEASEKVSVTWAGIVRNGRPVKGKNQSVVSSSFSRNNPVS